MNPYRYLLFENNEVKFEDFMNYFSDARAIGFSKKKAMNYAWDCCYIDMEKRRMKLSGTFSGY